MFLVTVRVIFICCIAFCRNESYFDMLQFQTNVSKMKVIAVCHNESYFDMLHAVSEGREYNESDRFLSQ